MKSTPTKPRKRVIKQPAQQMPTTKDSEFSKGEVIVVMFATTLLIAVTAYASYWGAQSAITRSDHEALREGLIAKFSYQCGKNNGQLTLLADGGVDCDLSASTSTQPLPNAEFI